MSGNALEAPDAKHQMYGGAATSKASMVATDKFTLRVVDNALTRSKKMIGAAGRSHRMSPVRIGEGKAKHFCLVMSVEQANDVRQEVGDASWLAIAKALAMTMWC
jgi:Protein of unknown function (DUF4043)